MTKKSLIIVTSAWILAIVAYCFWCWVIHPLSWDPHNFREWTMLVMCGSSYGVATLWHRYFDREYQQILKEIIRYNSLGCNFSCYTTSKDTEAVHPRIQHEERYRNENQQHTRPDSRRLPYVE